MIAPLARRLVCRGRRRPPCLAVNLRVRSAVLTSERRAVTSPSITELLLQIREGDSNAYESLLPLVYEELRRMAERALRHERVGHTL